MKLIEMGSTVLACPAFAEAERRVGRENLFILVFALVFCWYGIAFVQFGWHQTSELAELPMQYIFVEWQMAGFTWIVFLGERFVADVRTLAAPAAA